MFVTEPPVLPEYTRMSGSSHNSLLCRRRTHLELGERYATGSTLVLELDSHIDCEEEVDLLAADERERSHLLRKE